MHLIAFACHPSLGSEEGVGWSWSQVISSEFQVERIYVAPSYLEPCIRSRPDLPFCSVNGWFDPGGVSGKLFNNLLFKPLIRFFYKKWLAAVLAHIDDGRNGQSVDIWVCTYVGFEFVSAFRQPWINLSCGPVGGVLVTPEDYFRDLSIRFRLFHCLRNYNIKRSVRRLKSVMPFIQFDKVIAAGENTKLILEDVIKKPVAIHSEVFFPFSVINSGREVLADSGVDPVRVLIAGSSLTEMKGLDYVIDVLWELCLSESSALLSEFEVCFVGRLDKKYARKLENLPVKLIFKGVLDRQSVLNVMRNNDIFLYHSYLDLTSSVLSEAVASGLAVIAPRVFEFENAVHNLENGFLIDASAPRASRVQEAVSRLVELAKDRPKLNTMKANSIGIARNSLSVTSVERVLRSF